MSGGHHPPGSLSVAQLLVDAKRLAGRLREHDDSANRVVSNAQETLKAVAGRVTNTFFLSIFSQHKERVTFKKVNKHKYF